MNALDRRGFLAAGGALAAGAMLGAHGAEMPGAASAFTTIAYNVYGCDGWPRTRANRERLAAARPGIPERLALELALYSPDVVTFSEAPDEDVVADIARRLGMTYAFYPSPEGFPGSVLTRHAIGASANCPLAESAARPADLMTRHFGRALLETPLGELAVYSAHLNPHESEIRLR